MFIFRNSFAIVNLSYKCKHFNFYRLNMELFKPKDILKANPKLSFIGGEHFGTIPDVVITF